MITKTKRIAPLWLAIALGATAFGMVALGDTATTKTMCNPQKTSQVEVPNPYVPFYQSQGWTLGPCKTSPP